MLFVFPAKILSQDCSCKYWKKTSYNSSGQMQFTYKHACDQPTSEYEYIGYDLDFCKQLKEEEANRIAENKKNVEAGKILQNTPKKEFQNGYKVIAWWGKWLGNTGKWATVGEPRCGIKEDSTIISWNEDSSIRFEGKIKNQRLNGLIKFNVGPFYDLVEIGNHLGLMISETEPDYIFYNESGSYDQFSSALKQEKVRRIIGGDNSYEYKDNNGNWNRCFYYFFYDNKIIMFTDTVDETRALEINEKIEKIEIQKSKERYNAYKNKLEKIINKYTSIEERYNKIKTHQLNSHEESIVGKWNFSTDPIWIASKGCFQLKEGVELKKDNTFIYTFDFFKCDGSFSFSNKKYGKEGYWFYDNGQINLIPKETDVYDTERVKKGLPFLSVLIELCNIAIQKEKILPVNNHGDDVEDLSIYLSLSPIPDVNTDGVYLSAENNNFLDKDLFNDAVVKLPFNLVGVEKIKKEDYFLNDSMFFLFDKKESKWLTDMFKEIIVFKLLKGKKEK